MFLTASLLIAIVLTMGPAVVHFPGRHDLLAGGLRLQRFIPATVIWLIPVGLRGFRERALQQLEMLQPLGSSALLHQLVA